MRQGGVSERPDELWSDHEWEETGVPWEETTPAATSTRTRPSVPAPPDEGMQDGSRAIAPTRSRVAPARSERSGPTRPGARTPGSAARGVPASSGAVAPTRSTTAAPGRPAQGGSRPDPDRPAPRDPGQGVPGRRTVKIQGRGAERNLIHSSRRPQRRPSERRHERAGFKPDRVAMWAVLLGVLLILVAATSSHAAVFSHAASGSHQAAPAAAPAPAIRR